MQGLWIKTAALLLLLATFVALFFIDDVYRDAAHLLQELIFGFL